MKMTLRQINRSSSTRLTPRPVTCRSATNSCSKKAVPEQHFSHFKAWTSAGKQEVYTYDNLGRILSKTQSATDGSSAITTTNRYDKNGNLRFATDGNGNETSYTYDSMNQLLSKAQGGHTTGYSYDANGNVCTITDWRLNTSTNVFDALNRLIEQKDAYNHTVQSFTYNNNSVQITSTDALGCLTTYVYDKNNRLVQTIDPANHTTSQTYDNVGQTVTKTDANGNTTQYAYDEFNRLITVTNAKGETTAYTYDQNGNVLTLTDGSGHVTTYEYNCVNLLVKAIKDGGRTGVDPTCTYDLSKVQSYTYEANGQLATRTDRNGNTTTYTYDIHGRLLSRTAVSPTGSVTVSYTYDNNGNVLTMTDGTGTTTRVYDALGRATSKTVPYIGTSTYAYDLTTGLDTGCTAETTTDPNGNVTKKVYDRVGRLSEVIADSMTTVYHYFDNGSLQNVVYGSGAREDYTYTVNNLLSTLVNKKADSTIIDSYNYTYDAAHNLLTKIDARGTTTYTYDTLNRLLTVTEPGGKGTSYTYDASGNRLTQTQVVGTDTTVTTYTYDAQNHLTGTVAKLNGVTTETVAYAYDNNGNQLTKTSTAYIAGVAQTPVIDQTNTYDLFNQLISTVTSGGVTVINTYNGDGLRVEKTVSVNSVDTTTRYLYEYDKVVLEESGSGLQTGRNVYGINLITRQVGGDTFIYMYNGHADVTALVGTNGNVAATYYYDAFGNILDQTGSISNNILYAGYQYDPETGLYYLNARMYDPLTARFMQEDTYTGEYSDPLSLNLYTYCHNEPLMYSDPTGHSWLSSAFNWIGNTVKSAVTTVANAVANTSVGKTVIKAVSTAANSDMGKTIIQKVADVKKTVTGACKSAASAVEKAYSKVKNDVTPYSNAIFSAELGIAVSIVKDGFLDAQIPIVGIVEQAVFKTDILKNTLEGIYNTAESDVLNNWVSNKTAYYAGRTAGNVVSIAQGISAIIGGVAMIAGSITVGTGGVALSSTGAGAIVGVPTIAIAGVALAEGSAVLAVGLGALSGGAKNISGNINKFNSSSTERIVTSEGGLDDVASKLTGNKKLYFEATGKIPTGEVHHTLPQQFADEFAEVGLDVNNGEFLYDIPKDVHRLYPDGLHTTTNPLGQTWNATWKDFFMKNPDYSKADVLNQWKYMIQKTGIDQFK